MGRKILGFATQVAILLRKASVVALSIRILRCALYCHELAINSLRTIAARTGKCFSASTGTELHGELFPKICFGVFMASLERCN